MPYPGGEAFQPWCLERDFFTAFLLTCCGPGPWPQWHWLIGVLASFFIIRQVALRDLGPGRAWLLAGLATFGNCYALLRLPVHLNIAACHWLSVVLVVDSLILWRIGQQRRIPWDLVYLRIAFSALCFGLDPSYVCGASITIGIAVLSCICAVVFWRCRWHHRRWKAFFRAALSGLDRSVWPRRLAFTAIILVIGIYLPSLLSIVIEVRSFDFSGVPAGAWWTSPLRLLLPILPSTNLFILGDVPEFAWDGSPGLAILLLAASGLIAGGRRSLCFLPLIFLILAAACIRPDGWWNWQVLPWHGFCRVGPRALLIVVPIASTIGLLAWPWIVPGIRMWIAPVLLMVFSAEASTAFSCRLPVNQTWLPSNDFTNLMVEIRASPGAAVLDVPPVIVGGNGVGVGLPSLPMILDSQASLSVFHGKQVVSAYRGRIHPQSIASHLDSGWDRWIDLLCRGPPSNAPPAAQNRYLDQATDFAQALSRRIHASGMLVYPQLLDSQVHAAFIRRFSPAQSAAFPPSGTISWYPLKATGTGSQEKFPRPVLDPGRSLRPLDREWAWLLGKGWSSPEPSHQWGIGPCSHLHFGSPDPPGVKIELLVDWYAEQRVSLSMDGVDIAVAQTRPARFVATLSSGRPHNLTLHASAPVSPKALGMSDDIRSLGVSLIGIRTLAMAE